MTESVVLKKEMPPYNVFDERCPTRDVLARIADKWALLILARLENDVFPWIGKKPVADLLAPDLLAVVRRVEGRGAGETAHRVLQNIGQVLRYAVITGRADRDVSADLRGALAPVRGKNLAAIVEPAKVGPLLRMLDSYEGSFIVASALRLAPLVFVRPGELQKYL